MGSEGGFHDGLGLWLDIPSLEMGFPIFLGDNTCIFRLYSVTIVLYMNGYVLKLHTVRHVECILAVEGLILIQYLRSCIWSNWIHSNVSMSIWRWKVHAEIIPRFHKSTRSGWSIRPSGPSCVLIEAYICQGFLLRSPRRKNATTTSRHARQRRGT